MKRVKVYAPAAMEIVSSLGALALAGEAFEIEERDNRQNQPEAGEQSSQQLKQLAIAAVGQRLEELGEHLEIRLASGKPAGFNAEFQHEAGLNCAKEAALWSGAQVCMISPNGGAAIAVCRDRPHAEYVARVMKWAMERRGLACSSLVSSVDPEEV